MNTVFEKNIEALKKRYPDLSERIMETKENPDYKIIQAKNGKPNVLIRKDSQFLMLYDNDDPEKYCDAFLEKLNMNYAPIVIFMGLGLGYHLDRYFKLLGERLGTREIIVFEKDIELFTLALKVGDYSNVFNQSNIHFMVGASAQGPDMHYADSVLRKRDITIALKSLKIIPLPASIMLDEKYYQEIHEAIKKIVRQIMILTGNDSMDSLMGFENILHNLEHVFSNPGINTLFDKFKKKPGVLVAAGPSLNKNMHLLKGIKDRALIISCDASFIPLRKNGIRPHLVTSLERTPGVDLFYKGIEDFNGTYFIALPILMPEVMDSFKGRHFVAYRGYSHFDWLGEDKGSVIVGTSVANLCFQILKALGCDPIILIGQDLAFAEDGDTHVKGDIFGSRAEYYHEQPYIELEGNNGKPVRSEKAWEIMKRTYESDIAAYDGTCINSTEGGAKIIGTEIMPFKKAIETHCREKFKPDQVLDEAYSGFSQKVDIKSEIKRIYEKGKGNQKILDHLIQEFEDAYKLSIDAEKNIIDPFLENDSEDVDLEHLASIEKKFLELTNLLAYDKKNWELMAHTLNAYDVCFSNEMGFLRDIYTDEKCLAMARVKKIKDWFSVVGHFLVLTKDLLVKADKRLEQNI